MAIVVKMAAGLRHFTVGLQEINYTFSVLASFCRYVVKQYVLIS